MPTHHGFTLLELILVLTILGLIAGIVSLRLRTLRNTQIVDQAAQYIIDQSLRCQTMAQQQMAMVRLRIDADHKKAIVQVVNPLQTQSDQESFCDGLDTLTATFVRDDGVSTSGLIDVLFRPDSRCDSPGLLTLTCNGQPAALRFPAGSRLPFRESVAVKP